jgi:hypothetical protein
MSLFVRALYVLLALAFVVLTYFVVIWVLDMLGISIPDKILKVVFVIIGLIALISVLTGKFDNIFKTPVIPIVIAVITSQCTVYSIISQCPVFKELKI